MIGRPENPSAIASVRDHRATNLRWLRDQAEAIMALAYSSGRVTGRCCQCPAQHWQLRVLEHLPLGGRGQPGRPPGYSSDAESMIEGGQAAWSELVPFQPPRVGGRGPVTLIS